MFFKSQKPVAIDLHFMNHQGQKPCSMCPFYTLSTCPSKGLCTALLQSNRSLSRHMTALVGHLVKRVLVCGSDPGSNPVRSVSFSQCSNVCVQSSTDVLWIIQLTDMLGVLVKGNFLNCAIIYKG